VTNYSYDTLNRLTGLTDFNSGVFNFGYDALGRRTNLTRPNGVSTSYAYDSLSRLLSILHQSSAFTGGANYAYDAAGNRTSKTEFVQAGGPNPAQVVSNYSYDPIYQLTQAVVNGTTAETYSYDAVGNRLSSLGASPYSYNNSNELTAKPGVTFTYDNNGNMVTKAASSGTTTYAWDFENRLSSVTLPGTGGTVSFKYDPFGRRIEKVSSVGTTIFAYDGDNIVEELGSTGTSVARYTQGLGIDEPLAMYRGGAAYYYHTDGLGSIEALTDSKAHVAAGYLYDSFGNLTASTGKITNPFRYTARELDSETGLYYYRARYYDPSVGRFLSEDPIKFVAGINFYAYAFNNAPNRQDAYGLDANNWTYGEIRSWAVGPAPGFAPPQGLGDAKASIAAACALNGGGCADVNGATATDAADQAAWRNITQANGTDRSGGGNFMCVGTQGCWFVHKCYECSKGKKILVDRPAALKPSGTVNVGAHTLYFYNDSLQGWCNEKDKNCGCSRK